MRHPVWVNDLSEEEIVYLNSFVNYELMTKGTIGSTESLKDIRRSRISWLHDEKLKDFLYEKFQRANREAFGFDISYIVDVQLSEYDSEYEGHYDWHIDVDWSSQFYYDRKLSMSIQLTDPNDYVGGDLKFRDFSLDAKHQGAVIIFPSYLYHQVTPVTEGKRLSLVSWTEGPRWK